MIVQKTAAEKKAYILGFFLYGEGRKGGQDKGGFRFWGEGHTRR